MNNLSIVNTICARAAIKCCNHLRETGKNSSLSLNHQPRSLFHVGQRMLSPTSVFVQETLLLDNDFLNIWRCDVPTGGKHDLKLGLKVFKLQLVVYTIIR